MATLQSQAFHALDTPEPISGLSVLQAAVIEGDVRTTKEILDYSPDVVDIIMVLVVPVLSSSASQYKGKKLEEILKLLDTPYHKEIQELLKLHCKGLEKRSLIHLAARQGNIHHIRKLIAQGADIIRPSLEESEEYATVLNHAAEHNSIEVIEELLHHGASLQAKDYRGFNAIHFAARGGRTETVVYMLDRDTGLRDAVGQGYTPLHLAAWGGYTETVASFISHGADVNVGRQHESYDDIHYDVYPENDFCAGVVGCIGELTMLKTGTTPTMLAAARGHLETFDFLEQKGGRTDQSVLIQAAKGGNLSLLKKLVSAGLDVNARGYRGATLLHLVGSAEAAEFLIKLGLDVNARDEDEGTPLHDAARRGNVKLADVLIQHGADITATNYHGYSTLAQAVCVRDPDPNVVSYFAEKSRESGKDNKTDVSPLHFADRFGPDVAMILLDFGFDVNGKHHNTSPLHRAAEGDPDTFRVLVEHGADIYAKDHNGYEPCHLVAQHGTTKSMQLLLTIDASLVHAVDRRKGRTALHWAVMDRYRNGSECVQLLLDYGSDVLAVDNEGDTALHHSSKEIVQVLLRHAATVNKDIVNAVNKEGFTALHIAADSLADNMVQVFLKSGFAIDAIDNKGRTPLHLAAKQWDTDAFKVLLESGADATIVDKDGNTVFHSAADTGCPGVVDIMETLYDRGLADVNSCNADGRTPLHLCCAGGGDAKARFLLEKGADISAVDNSGCTALHFAARHHYPEALELLIEKGANINAADSDGNTPLHVAAPRAYNLPFLIEHGADVNIANKMGETPNDILQRRNGNH